MTARLFVVCTVVTDEAFVTLVTSDNYALGALVLSASLRRVNTTRQLVVMVTTGVSQAMRSVTFCVLSIPPWGGGTAAASPLPFRPGDPVPAVSRIQSYSHPLF